MSFVNEIDDVVYILTVLSFFIFIGCYRMSLSFYHTHYCKILLYYIIAGLPRARSARGTEPHTHGIWSTSFRLVVTWLTERTYASTDCTGRVGETIKRKGGVSQACLGKSSSFIYDTHNMVNWLTTDQYPMTISRAHVSTHRGDVIYLEAVRWPVNRFTRSQTMFNHTF